MQLENSLKNIEKAREILSNEKQYFSGIDALDNHLKYFYSDKKYLFVAQSGMGLFSFANTLETNIRNLYNVPYFTVNIIDESTDLKELDMQIHNINIYSIESEKPTSIESSDLPNKILDFFDEIFALYRPEYFGIDVGQNGLKTLNKIELINLKTTSDRENKTLCLNIDKENKKVSSISKKYF